MKRLLTGAAVLAVALVVNGTATAGWHPSSGGGKSYSGGSMSHPNYSQSYGKSFSHGYYYPGKNHFQWTYQCYSPKYGCNCYWCPSACCYYYWCQPSNCYYPVSYIASAPPCYTPAPSYAPSYAAPAPVQVQVQTQTQTQTQTQANGPPPGVPLP
jgi:hypothetical protein